MTRRYPHQSRLLSALASRDDVKQDVIARAYELAGIGDKTTVSRHVSGEMPCSVDHLRLWASCYPELRRPILRWLAGEWGEEIAFPHVAVGACLAVETGEAIEASQRVVSEYVRRTADGDFDDADRAAFVDVLDHAIEQLNEARATAAAGVQLHGRSGR